MVNKDHKRFLRKAKDSLFPDAPDPEQVTELFEAIGVALTTWQYVEEKLYLLYERAALPQRPGAAACGFHALQFAGKLLVTDAAVRFAILSAEDETAIKELTEEWADLFDKTRRKVSSRNHFAHFSVFSYLVKPVKEDKVRLEPSVYDFRYAAGLIEKKSYKLNDIRVHTDGYLKVATKLQAFLEKIPPPKERRKASS